MQSLREIYKIGRGPSSSHTMGPERAVKIMRERFPEADFLKVTLYGSLALTGSNAKFAGTKLRPAPFTPTQWIWKPIKKDGFSEVSAFTA